MAFETGGKCFLAWKRRTGMSSAVRSTMSLFMSNVSSWEQRWIVVTGTQLSYYCLGEEDGTPRGTIDLIAHHAQIQVTSVPSSDAPSPHEIDITATTTTTTTNNNNNNTNGNTANTTTNDPSSSSNNVMNNIQWKFCFETQQDLMEFLEIVHGILEKGGQFVAKDADRFEHDFIRGDHIYRWEMIVCPPVIYPIQIHGIVLEAGRNCVVVADFGLTGYGRKEGDKFNFVDDHDESRNSYNAVLAAWKKLRPNQDQRLNILTLTDPHEIRKWTKANYESFFANVGSSSKKSSSSKFDKIGKFFGKVSPSHSEEDEETSYSSHHEDESSSSSLHASFNGQSSSNSPTKPKKGSGTEPLELPRTDPTEIVLARANFVLEHGEEVLPPYHVFFSNSECIAVWCKTGRWSTFQTAVFLSTTSVGAAKSSGMATLGVAAANPLLAPVVAIGGIIWVGAPMVILKKSREKWEEATVLMTRLFWEWAPPSVFVSAIENWSGVGMKSRLEKKNQLKPPISP